MSENGAWYVVRTRQFKERVVAQAASSFVDEIYVPFCRARRRSWGKVLERTEPLFPCYVFAYFSMDSVYHRLMRSVGVVGVVCAGSEPCPVHPSIIEEIRDREEDGLIVLNPPRLAFHQPVTITTGYLRGFDAVFEDYRSGEERVAVLLHALGRPNVRTILNTSDVSAATLKVAQKVSIEASV